MTQRLRKDRLVMGDAISRHQPGYPQIEEVMRQSDRMPYPSAPNLRFSLRMPPIQRS